MIQLCYTKLLKEPWVSFLPQLKLFHQFTSFKQNWGGDIIQILWHFTWCQKEVWRIAMNPNSPRSYRLCQDVDHRKCSTHYTKSQARHCEHNVKCKSKVLQHKLYQIFGSSWKLNIVHVDICYLNGIWDEHSKSTASCNWRTTTKIVTLDNW